MKHFFSVSKPQVWRGSPLPGPWHVPRLLLQRCLLCHSCAAVACACACVVLSPLLIVVSRMCCCGSPHSRRRGPRRTRSPSTEVKHGETSNAVSVGAALVARELGALAVEQSWAVARRPPASHAGRGEYSVSVLLSDAPLPRRRAPTRAPPAHPLSLSFAKLKPEPWSLNPAESKTAAPTSPAIPSAYARSDLLRVRSEGEGGGSGRERLLATGRPTTAHSVPAQRTRAEEAGRTPAADQRSHAPPWLRCPRGCRPRATCPSGRAIKHHTLTQHAVSVSPQSRSTRLHRMRVAGNTLEAPCCRARNERIVVEEKLTAFTMRVHVCVSVCARAQVPSLCCTQRSSPV